jgi:uncharacterized protein (DUF1330 family)
LDQRTRVEVSDSAAVADYVPGLTAVVLIEFPDAESARAWYESPEYQPLKAIRPPRGEKQRRLTVV